MMNRLRDQKGAPDRVLARAAELLQSAGPTEPSPQLERRVWMSLRSPRPRGGRWIGLTRPSLVAAVIAVSTAAAAAATVGRGWIERTYLSVTLRATHDELDSPRAAKRRALVHRGAAPASAETSGQTANTPPAPGPEPLRANQSEANGAPAGAVGSALAAGGAEEAPIVAPRIAKPAPAVGNVRPVSPAARSSAGAKGAEKLGPATGSNAFASAPRDEASLVLSAMTALRRDREPARSAKLLDDYLARFPRGALREEALALEIECASSRGDTAGTERWARAYLRSFPNGRFQDAARDALGRGSDPASSP